MGFYGSIFSTFNSNYVENFRKGNGFYRKGDMIRVVCDFGVRFIS